MRIFIIIILVSFSSCAQKQEKVTVGFNKNIEFLGYVIELVDPSDKDSNHAVSKIIHQYPEDTEHKVLSEMLEIATNIDYSTLIHLMYFLPEFPLEENYVITKELSHFLGNSKQDSIKLNTLVKKTNSFYKLSQFDKIWNELTNERKKVIELISKMKPENAFFEKMEWFYQKKFQQYHFSPSLTLWPAGFGVKDIEKKRANHVFGPIKNYQFRNKEDFITHAIHEFGHSFVNSVVLQNKDEISKSSYLYDPIRKEITRQGYTNWETCVIELFVRAGEVIINEELGNFKKSKAVLDEYANQKKWIYLPFIVEKLKHYRIEKKIIYELAVTETIKDLKKVTPK